MLSGVEDNLMMHPTFKEPILTLVYLWYTNAKHNRKKENEFISTYKNI